MSLRGFAASAALVGLAACSGNETGPAPVPTAECSSSSQVSLAPGGYTLIDPSVRGSCVRVPAAGGTGAQYLYVALATNGVETSSGVEDAYSITAGAPGAATASVAATSRHPLLASRRTPTITHASAFHNRLLEYGHSLAARSSRLTLRTGAQAAISAAVTKPQVGDARTFTVCANSTCNPNTASDFTQTSAHVKYVGDKVAIYLDDNAPANGYTQNDIDQVGALFDDYLYPIDTTAFGRESDHDQNGVVVVLLTQKVNALSPGCTATGSVILGYFYSLDLQSHPRSNNGEIFYGLVPDPNSEATTNCSISTSYANRNLPPTFIHEFQHMINANYHDENTWLNEGLSHFAEELGGRKIPDARCVSPNCLTQFAASNLGNAYDYLADPEVTYLIAPGSSTGTLEERGAGWLFVRWLADQYGTDQYGTNVTRALINPTRVGADNVAHVAGRSFSNLVPLWQMANYLDNLPGFTSSSPFLQYSTWNLRAVFSSFHSQDPSSFPDEYPLVPDQVTTAPYDRAGLLLGGSGVHLLVTQPSGGGEIDVRLTAEDGTSLPPSTVTPMIGLVRIR